MNLPHEFQFRNKHLPDFTHVAKMNANGDYEVEWAQGYSQAMGVMPLKVYDSDMLEMLFEVGTYVLVTEKLPDEFICTWGSDGIVYNVKLLNNEFVFTWDWPANSEFQEMVPTTVYSKESLLTNLKRGDIKILDKKPLTTEEQRRKRDFEEQIAQLAQYIKLNEQDVEHKLRLIANYKARQKDLQEMITKLEAK